MKYRSEIDGLRAVAVLPVILFHAGVETFSGGYVGVDVFLVISGYLITSIVLTQVRAGSFSLLRFYERRARRILPALFLVMLCCIPPAYLLMLPDDLENFGQSLVATTAFANNVLLFLTSGYWAHATEFKPLVHTWSLGVEEQYYAVAPLLVMLFWRSRPLLLASLLLGVLFSLAFSQFAVARWPDFNFYLIFSRVWELGLGALVAVHLADRRKQPGRLMGQNLSLLGLVLIGLAIVTFDAATPHPAWPTLLPVLGTVLVIVYAADNNAVGALLSRPWLVGIGLVSFSAYLWHQPLFAFARIASLEEPSTWLLVALGGLSLGLAYLSWRFVESPCRDRLRTPGRVFMPAIGAAAMILAGTGYYLHDTAGLLHRWPELAQHGNYGSTRNIEFNESAFRFKDARFSDNGRPNVLVIGNSFARDFINAGLANGYFRTHNLSYTDEFEVCDVAAAESHLERMKASDFIIFASGYSGEKARCIVRFLGTGAARHARVIVIGSKNFGANNNAVMLLPEERRYGFRARVMDEAMRFNREAAHVLPAEHYVDIIAMLADEQGRVPVFTPDRRFISQDRQHLTRDGARYVGQIIFEHPLLRPLK